MKRMVLLLALALVSCVTSKTEAPLRELGSPSDLRFQIGGMFAMLSNAEDLSRQVPEVWREEKYDPSAAELAASLHELVWKFNITSSNLCARGYLVESSCRPAYVPQWLHENPETVTSMREVDARALEVAHQVEPLWKAACQEAEARLEFEQWQPYCHIE
jgi:hypothetical protein